MGQSYRHDIDGLRAVAVLMVFAFHLGFSGVPGGFVGVDVFYVISGYVIFRGALADMGAGRFSIAGFYRRRMRRIVPALMFTMLFCFGLGALVMSPGEYAEMARTAVAATFSLSNFYFYDHSGYFATAAHNIPLLHTWSLGVEEQFYLLVPLLFLVVRKRYAPARVVRLLVGVGLLTFLCNLIALHVLADAAMAFYLPTSRLWEIAAGALAACHESAHRPAPSRRTAYLASVTGVIGLVLSACVLDETYPFPGVVALLPVVSALLVIMAGPVQGSVVDALLTMRPAQFIGRISYSLYLFHWPLVVFAGLYLGRDLVLAEQLGILFAGIGLAWLSWRFVEEPFRRRDGWSGQRKALACMTAGMLALSLVTVMQEGFPGRLNAEAQAVVQSAKAAREHKSSCLPSDALAGIPRAVVCASSTDRDAPSDYILWGDSHAEMLWAGLSASLSAQGKTGLSVTLADCHPLLDVYTSKKKNREACLQLGNRLVEQVRTAHVPVVILASRWARLYSPVPAPGDGSQSKQLFDVASHQEVGLETTLLHTVDRLRAAGAKVVVVGPVPEVEFDVPEMLVRAIRLDKPMPASTRADFDIRQTEVMKALQAVAARDGVRVVYPHQVLCDAGRCMTTQDRQALYYDDDHLSAAGVALVLPAIREAVLR